MKVRGAILDGLFGISTGGMFSEDNASREKMYQFVLVLRMTADLETLAFCSTFQGLRPGHETIAISRLGTNSMTGPEILRTRA